MDSFGSGDASAFGSGDASAFGSGDASAGARVAESLIVHLASAAPSAAEQWLDRRLPGAATGTWNVPSADGYFVLIYRYDDHRTEFEPAELEQLCGLLGQFPSCAFQFELRRSLGRAAHDAAAALATEMLREFDGVIQDISGEVYWLLADLEAGKAPHAAAELWPDASPGTI